MTRLVGFSKDDIPNDHYRRQIRAMSKKQFIRSLCSNSLIKNKIVGNDIDNDYLQQRVAFEFGEQFEVIKSSRVSYRNIDEQTSHQLVELFSLVATMNEIRPFVSDWFVCKEFKVSYANDKVRYCAGILLENTSCDWLPKDRIVCSFVVEKKLGSYMMGSNPLEAIKQEL